MSRRAATLRCAALLAAVGGTAACNSKANVARLDPPGEVDAYATGQDTIVVRWTAVPGISHYHVRGFQGAIGGPPSGDDDVVEATEYPSYETSGEDVYFQVTAVAGGAESAPGPIVKVRPRPWTVLAEAPAWTYAGTAGAQLGSALAAGDVDGDGLEDLVVGAPGEGGGRGRAYLIPGRFDGLTPTALWTSSGGNVNEAFGSGLAIADVDADGFGDVIVGTPGGNGGADLFRGATQGPPTTFNARYSTDPGQGQAIASCGGDLSGDTRQDLIVGAPASTDANNGQGEIYALAVPGTTFQEFFNHTGQDDSEALGSAVACTSGNVAAGGPGDNGGKGAIDVRKNGSTGWSAVRGNTNGSHYGAAVAFGRPQGDGALDIVIGQPDDSSGGTVFYRSADGTNDKGNTNGHNDLGFSGGAQFGAAIVRFPDLDAASSGFAEDLAVGAPGDGSVVVYRLLPGNTYRLFADTQGDSFGAALAEGDFNGDGYPDLAVGNPTAGGGAGSVAMYLGGPARSPLVLLGGPLAALEGHAFQLSGASFVDEATRQRHVCTIDWGDGSAATTIDACTSAALAAAQHVYPVTGAGRYLTVTVTVTAIDGRLGQSAARIAVGPSTL